MAAAVAVAAAAVIGVAVCPAARQIAPVMVLDCNVTAPVYAKARPFKVAPLFKVMDASARIFPKNEVVVSRVADVSALHHTLHGSPPVTDEPDDVMTVSADLKIQTPDPLRVSVPDNLKASAQ